MQLELGVRAFDLRPCKKSGETFLRTCHNPPPSIPIRFWGPALSSNFAAVKDFLQLRGHENEYVILLIQSGGGYSAGDGFTPDQHAVLVQQIKTAFGGLIFRHPHEQRGTWPSVRAMTTSGARVILITDQLATYHLDTEIFHLFRGGDHSDLVGEWANAMTLTGLYNHVTAESTAAAALKLAGASHAPLFKLDWYLTMHMVGQALETLPVSMLKNFAIGTPTAHSLELLAWWSNDPPTLKSIFDWLDGAGRTYYDNKVAIFFSDFVPTRVVDLVLNHNAKTFNVHAPY